MPAARKSASKTSARKTSARTTSTRSGQGVRARAAARSSATRREVEQSIARFEKRLEEANEALKALGGHLGTGARGSYKEVTAALVALRRNAARTNKQALKDFDKLRHALTQTNTASSSSRSSRSSRKSSGTSRSTTSRSTAKRSTAARSTAKRSSTSRSTGTRSSSSRAKKS